MTHTEKQGFVVFFTGLSGSGKTTLSKELVKTLKDQNRLYRQNSNGFDKKSLRRIF